MALRPSFQSIAGELRAVVESLLLGLATQLHQLVQTTNDALSRQVGVDLDLQCLAVEVVNSKALLRYPRDEEDLRRCYLAL